MPNQNRIEHRICSFVRNGIDSFFLRTHIKMQPMVWSICKAMLTVGRLKYLVSYRYNKNSQYRWFERKTKSDIFFIKYIPFFLSCYSLYLLSAFKICTCINLVPSCFLNKFPKRWFDANLSKHQIIFWISFDLNERINEKQQQKLHSKKKKQNKKAEKYPRSPFRLSMMYKIT